MTPARLAELKSLATAPGLTPGPWSAWDNAVWLENPDGHLTLVDRPTDLSLMAAARLGMPELVAEVERLLADNANLQGQLTTAQRMMSRLLPPD